MFLRVGYDLLNLLLWFVPVHGHLQGVHVGCLALDDGGEMSPGGASFVRVLVVHRVLAGEVSAVLCQHFGEDNVTLIPEYAVISIAYDVEAEESVGDVEVQHKVQRLLSRGCKAGDDLVGGLNGGVEVLRALVPHSVQVRPCSVRVTTWKLKVITSPNSDPL